MDIRGTTFWGLALQKIKCLVYSNFTVLVDVMINLGNTELKTNKAGFFTTLFLVTINMH